VVDCRESCCLCGRPPTGDDPLTREHLPPKQFYPKSLRPGLNLWTIPTHKSCNHRFKEDEEYFYHALYLLVANANPTMASIILGDLERRARKPQTRKLMRSILGTQRSTTASGVVLPRNFACLDVDKYRVQQVAIKIGQCLFFRDNQRYVPSENCKDIRLCESENDVPEMYQLSWELSKVNVNDLPRIEGSKIVIAAPEDGGNLPPRTRRFSATDQRTLRSVISISTR
jgi:hypothetical protein